MMRLFAIPLLAIGLNAATTYNRDVAPILYKHCTGCHRPGEIAPMSLMDYRSARPWAKAIKQSVTVRKMPPWFADARYSHFQNDRSLKQSEIDVISQWADSGAAEGNAKDAPAAKARVIAVAMRASPFSTWASTSARSSRSSCAHGWR